MKTSKKEGYIRNTNDTTSPPETPEFNLNFYNPFEIKHRRRTSRNQLKALEKAFTTNPKPNGKFRQALAENLSMSPRNIQVWFQNRRAKAKQQSQSRDKKQDFAINPPSPVLFSAANMIHSRSQSLSTDSSWQSDNPTHMILSIRPDEPWYNSAEEASMSLSPSPSSSLIDQHNMIPSSHDEWPVTTMAGNVDPLTINNLADTWAYHSLLSKDNTCLLETTPYPMHIMDNQRPQTTRTLDDLAFHQRHVNDWIQTIALPTFEPMFNQSAPFELDEACQQLLQDYVPTFRA